MASSSSSSCLLEKDLEWIDLQIDPTELRPSASLIMGQCFNWKRLEFQHSSSCARQVWVGVLQGRALAVEQTTASTQITELASPPTSTEQQRVTREGLECLFRDYFQVSHSLHRLYEVWASRCDRLRAVSGALPGVRVLRQDPWECLVSFICSSNNNIGRITLMLDRLRRRYGHYLCSVRTRETEVEVSYHMNINDHSASKPMTKKRKVEEEEGAEEEGEWVHLYSFPTPLELAAASEDELRELGMGYRAKFIVGSSRFVVDKGEGWLCDLRSKGPAERLAVQEELLQLPGVGRKVADCVALFSLDQSEAIPVDTHVWSIAIRDYAPDLRGSRSLTPAIYERVGQVFRELFQEKAGWAHSLLFAAELPPFRPLLPPNLVKEMEQFNLSQKALKKSSK
eukprot:gene6958-7698_t